MCVGLISLACLSAAVGRGESRVAPSVIGRWDVTVQGTGGAYPSWFEVKLSGRRTLVGSYVGQFGSSRPIAKVDFEDGKLRFVVPPQWERRTTDVVYEGRFEGDMIQGENHRRRRPSPQVGGPPARRRSSARCRNPGASRSNFFNGRDLTGWKPQNPGMKNGWKVIDGALVNAEPGNNLMTDRKFTDFQIHAEFRIPKGSKQRHLPARPLRVAD